MATSSKQHFIEGVTPVALLPSQSHAMTPEWRQRRRATALPCGRLAVAGLVPAERLVRREGLPADRAPEAELLRQRGARAPLASALLPLWPSSVGAGERGETDREVVLLPQRRHGKGEGEHDRIKGGGHGS